MTDGPPVLNTLPVILASGSKIRASLLRSHGVDITIIKPGVDEDEIKREGLSERVDLEEIALRLARAKCKVVSDANDDIVIASDQILEFEGRAYDKPKDMEEAATRLVEMSGKTHSLINGTVVAKAGEVLWENISKATLTMKTFSRDYVDQYLEKVGKQVLSSVGAYQVETKEGAALFERISGDWSAVQGLALPPVLGELRRLGAFGEDYKDPKPIKAAVIGHPVAHSLSPMIHNEWARRNLVNGTYEAIDVAPDYDSFAAAMDRLRAEGYAGVNVTLPHKEHALRYADIASDWAMRIGAANMLTFNGESIVADNSDYVGILASLAGANVPGGPITVLILGAGGAARAAAVSLKELTAAEKTPRAVEIFITNRSAERADALADETGAKTIPWAERSAFLKNVDLLVNMTSLGMAGQPQLEIDLTVLSKEAVVFDSIYAPLDTDLLQTARARGNQTISGLEMLMHQAAPGFETWFGAQPYPVSGVVDDDLRDMLIEELKKRETT